MKVAEEVAGLEPEVGLTRGVEGEAALEEEMVAEGGVEAGVDEEGAGVEVEGA